MLGKADFMSTKRLIPHGMEFEKRRPPFQELLNSFVLNFDVFDFLIQKIIANMNTIQDDFLFEEVSF